jgi:hypothetical protein
MARCVIRTAAVIGVVIGSACAIWTACADEKHTKPAEPTAEGREFFEKHIRPVLVKHCYACHSAGAKTLEAGLLLDSREGLLKGGDSGPVITPGKPDKSRLLLAIRHAEEDFKMPPKEKLSDEIVKQFEKWIAMGAPDPRDGKEEVQHAGRINLDEAKKSWSFQPVVDHQPPPVKRTDWVRNDIDRFLLAALEQRELSPVADVDKHTLIRRATYDLTGLPPTPDEIDAFVADTSPDAFAHVVERLLGSPHYGEKWGRHWLDLARYADTSGCNSDFPVPSAYLYRNYVIRSFNADKPYDKFIREQIAGDHLPYSSPDERREQIIANGYLAQSRRFGSRNNEFHLTIEDTIDNVGKVFLGLTVSCARCHDHKFDPVPNEDYYALYGIFASTKYAFPGTEIYRHTKDFVALGGDEETAKLREWEAELAEADDKLELLLRELNRLRVREANGEKFAPDERTPIHVRAEMQEFKQKVERMEDRPPEVEKAYAASEGKPHDAKLHRKGDPAALGDVVPRGFLQVLGGQRLPPESAGSGRLELANWIADPHNPLTARVMANRIWQYHFGRGLVETPNDFGTRGKPPTHPELLDYLAARFIESGWSVKALHRMIVLSRAYQMAVSDDARNSTIDPENKFWWRFERRRLTAEEIRDSILAVGGGLDREPGGAHPFPPEGDWRYTQHKPFITAYPSAKRSIYLMQQRIKRHPLLEIFDGPDPNAATAVRAPSTTAIQSLYFMNDPLVHEHADKLAVRVGLAFDTVAERIDYAHQLVFGRRATSDELREAEEYLSQSKARLAAAGAARDEVARGALASYMRVLLSSNEFLFVE